MIAHGFWNLTLLAIDHRFGETVPVMAVPWWWSSFGKHTEFSSTFTSENISILYMDSHKWLMKTSPYHVLWLWLCGSDISHDDVIKWNHFPRYWPFVRGIHRSTVNSPHKGQWRGTLMFSLICVWINGWVNNREAGDLRHYRAHYDVIVMCDSFEIFNRV